MGKIPPELRAEVEKWRSFPRERPPQIETPGPGQESVWDYPRPPRLEPAGGHIRVLFGGGVIAETGRALRVLETSGPPVYYLPPEDTRIEYLEPAANSALCEWKGLSQYWSVQVGDRLVENAAWSYPDPWEGFEAIKDAIAFNAARMDACYVDEHLVTPQPGGYYGGWITPDITGPFKGAPGTERW
jgi:uncharacterized protein (DUF427 family)